jgi:hypothetical protein
MTEPIRSTAAEAEFRKSAKGIRDLWRLAWYWDSEALTEKSGESLRRRCELLTPSLCTSCELAICARGASETGRRLGAWWSNAGNATRAPSGAVRDG